MIPPLETNSGGLAKDMTLRDAVAMAAMSSLIGTILPALAKNPAYPDDDAAYNVVSMAAFAMADSFLIERERGE